MSSNEPGTEPGLRRIRRSSSRRKTRNLHLKQFTILVAGMALALVAGFLATGGLKPQAQDDYRNQAGSQTRDQGAEEVPGTSAEVISTMAATDRVDETTGSTQGVLSETACTAAGSIPLPAQETQGLDGSSQVTASSSPAVALEPSETTRETLQAAAAETTGEWVETGNWLEDRIARHRHEIAEQDLADFRTIIAKIDQEYISGLAAGGFSEEELELLQQHLNSRLSGGEYQRARELFATYSYLLDEDA